MYSNYEAEESVYGLIPPAQYIPPKPPMHKSKYDGKINPADFEFGVNSKRRTATLGLPNGLNAEHPSQFTRAHSKEPVLPEPHAPTNPKTKIRAPVPTRDDKPIMGLTSSKNFITSNAVEVILSKPKNVVQEEVPYTFKANYGQVPRYLEKNKEKIASEKEQFEQYMKLREQQATSNVTQLMPDEKSELLRHLKGKWASVNQAYQKISFTLDTPAKKQRKENYEKQLAEIERDIQLLERGDMVLVLDD